MRRSAVSSLDRAKTAPRHLVLVGGGHTHVHVLRSFAMQPVPDAHVTVVSAAAESAYSGMVPGVLAGLYEPAECLIDVAALAARAGADFVEDRIVAVRPERRTIEGERIGSLPYDVLSLDVGSHTLGAEAVRGHPLVVPVRPIEAAIARIRDFAAEVAAGRRRARAVVVGGGAGGVEIAFALRRWLAAESAARVALVERGPGLFPGGSPRLCLLVERVLRDYGIEVRVGQRDIGLDDAGVRLGDQDHLDAGLIVWATGAEGLPWLRSSGLATDERGFVLVDSFLRSGEHAEVFAAGDCARMREHPEMPRAGVYAVRQGPPLAHNLRASLTGRGRLVRYRPQSDFLSLLSTGDRRAIMSYYGRAGHGRHWWWLKDRIDRRFVARYAPPDPIRVRSPRESAMGGNASAMVCGGCAAKVDSATLAGLLAGIDGGSSADVAVGLAAPDDAAVLHHPAGADVVATIDAFPPFFGDLHAVAEIAAVNAASDVFAMGGTPHAALLLVGSAARAGAARDAELGLLMRGARAGLERLGVALVGGHTLEAGTALIGFAMLGRVSPGTAWTKGGARPGDRLVLTKPLGTGVVLAATRAGECATAWTASALASMRRSNGDAARLARAVEVSACTDVTGFGLVGHLSEMLLAGGVGARLTAGAIRPLPGALELLAAGWRSSADQANRPALAAVKQTGGPPDDVRLALLCDPQTSGGLLFAVPPGAADRLVEELRASGEDAAAIGEVVSGVAGEIELV